MFKSKPTFNVVQGFSPNFVSESDTPLHAYWDNDRRAALYIGLADFHIYETGPSETFKSFSFQLGN